MNTMKDKQRIFASTMPLSTQIRNAISALPDNKLENLREIRLRIGRAVSLNIGGKYEFVAKNGCLVESYNSQQMLVCTEQMMSEVYKNICGHSVYSHLNEIVSGFVTMPFGHRAGICGTAVISEGKIINIRDVSSINIRVSREVMGVATDISARFAKSFGGLLLCGAPASGKTTVLRDMARLLSTEHRLTISVVDTRNELSGTYKGKPQNDLGYSDVLSFYPRVQGIQQALRALSPQVIICDEIGNSDDIQAIMSSVNSGVRIIASIHAATPKELQNKSHVKELFATHAFSAVAFLSSPLTPGRISRIMSPEDVLRE